MRVLVLPVGCNVTLKGMFPQSGLWPHFSWYMPSVRTAFHREHFPSSYLVMPTPTQESVLLRNRMSTEITFPKKECVFGAGENSLGSPGSWAIQGALKMLFRGSLSPEGLRDGALSGWPFCHEKRTLFFS